LKFWSQLGHYEKKRYNEKLILYYFTVASVVQEEEIIYDKPRIILQKLRFDDPSMNINAICMFEQNFHSYNSLCLDLFPPELIPDLIKELNSPRTTRPRRSNNSRATSLDSSPKKKRQRNLSHEDEDYNDEDDDDDDDKDNEYQPLKKRIRRADVTNENSSHNHSFDAMSAFKKKTRDRLARKALDIDANPHENTSYKRFIKLLDTFNNDYERHHKEVEETSDEHYLDLLLSNHTLDEMATLSEKLKLSTYMTRVDLVKLKHLLEILSLRIKQGIEMSPILQHDINDEHKDNEKEEREWRNLVFERLTICANACEIALNIMTTPNMPKEIIFENVIEYTSLFIKSQLSKTIFPEYDPLYRSDNQANGKKKKRFSKKLIKKKIYSFLDPLLTKQKRSKVTGTKCKQVQILYNKIVSLFQGIADLMPLGKYTDTIILAVRKYII
jgi:cohesin loading factor subunit SCC2